MYKYLQNKITFVIVKINFKKLAVRKLELRQFYGVILLEIFLIICLFIKEFLYVKDDIML